MGRNGRWCFLLFLAGQVSIAEDAVPPPLEVVHRDVGSVQDMTKINPNEVGRDARRTWLLLKITPGEHSGAGHIPETSIKVEGGKYVVLPTAQVVIDIEGSCDVQAVLAGACEAKSFRYHWTFTLDKPRPTSVAIEQAPFCASSNRSGSTAICEVEQDQEDKNKFKATYVVPDGWERFAATAFAYLRSNRALFDDTLEQTERVRLETLHRDENPFLSLWAWKTLAPRARVDASIMKNLLVGRNSHLQAALLRVAFSSADEVSNEAVEEFRTFVNRIKSTGDLRGVALALVASFASSDPQVYVDPAKRKRMRECLLPAVRDRYAALIKDVKADDYIEYILTIIDAKK